MTAARTRDLYTKSTPTPPHVLRGRGRPCARATASSSPRPNARRAWRTRWAERRGRGCDRARAPSSGRLPPPLRAQLDDVTLASSIDLVERASGVRAGVFGERGDRDVVVKRVVVEEREPARAGATGERDGVVDCRVPPTHV